MRQTPWQSFKKGEWQTLIKQLQYTTYDAVIDAQGLFKSAMVAKFAKGPCYGFSRASVRDAIACFAYDSKVTVPIGGHAVEKVRQLFAQVLQYSAPTTAPDYGIDKQCLTPMSLGDNTVIFLHGTTWPTKHWPESYWCQLGYLVAKKGLQVLLPWGNEAEKLRAQRISQYCQDKGLSLIPEVLPKLSLAQITSLIAKAKGIVAVDTGLGHIAAAMAAPTISLYGPTDPRLTGAYGPSQQHLKVNASCAPCFGRECKLGTNFELLPPCFESLSPEYVFQALMQSMGTTIHKQSGDKGSSC
jgi:heptosyltransferase-1